MKNALLVLLLLCSHLLAGQVHQQLSDQAQISLITVAPGDEIYSIFGHSALRVSDPLHRIDRCYNYGTFEFDQPYFIAKFMRGKLLYFVDTETYRGFEYGNLRDRRAMQEQILNLDSTQRQRLYFMLSENALEANKYYKYDFFYDNCATRIRDIVENNFYQSLQYDSTVLPAGITLRQLLHSKLGPLPWTRFGIDIILGMPADRHADARSCMFLPDYMHDLLAGARINDTTLLVRSERNIPDRPLWTTPEHKPDWFQPLWVVLLLALIGLLSMANPRSARIFDAIFWFTLGIAGLIIFSLWFFTDHSATKMNWNILWALPSNLFVFWRKRDSEWADNYFLGVAMMAGLALLLWAFIPQQMPVEAIPIAALVFIKGMWGKRFYDKSV